MNQRDLEKAIAAEAEHWAGVEVEFVTGAKHPKAKFRFGGQVLSRPYAGTPSDANAIHITLGDMRRTMKQLGAKRDKPEPTREEDEAPYRKPNTGAAQRPSPVKGEAATPKPDVADQLVSAGAATPEAAEAARRDLESLQRANPDTRAVAQAEGAGQTYSIRALVEELREEGEDEEARAARLAELTALLESIVDGIYFGLPEAVYHAVPRLSASGLQKLCVSPATFWRGSWLDPERPELDEDQTKAQLLGKAYHCARLEPDRFHATYCRQPEKADFAGQRLITSDAAVKAALKDLGTTQAIANESLVERAERLRDEGHEGPIWTLIMAEHEHERAGRIALEGRHFDQIATDMERIRGQGEIAELLTGGQAEVSVFWTDEHGLPCKCRFDFLTPGWWDEFKTFDNSRGKVLEQALADAVRYNRYYVQAGHYRDGAEAIRTGGLQIRGEATDEQRTLIASIQIRPDELGCWFIFQEKGGVPNLLAREFPFYDIPMATILNDAGADEEAIERVHEATRRRTALHGRAAMEIIHAKDTFVLYANAYDPGTPWFPLSPRARFSDLDFNSYWLEGKN